MTYTVNHTDQTKQPYVVEDSTVNNATSVNLIGKNYTDFGTAMAENLLHLLENFADSTAPTQPVEGQLYYDTTNERLQYYDGMTGNGNWKSVASLIVQNTVPSGVGLFLIRTNNPI